MQTELGVRGGPSLSLSLARAEATLVIDGHLNWCGPDCWVLACLGLGCGWFSGCFFPVPGMWACLLVFVSLSRAVGYCLFVCVGCARMWAFGFCLSGVFVSGLMPLFP